MREEERRHKREGKSDGEEEEEGDMMSSIPQTRMRENAWCNSASRLMGFSLPQKEKGGTDKERKREGCRKIHKHVCIPQIHQENHKATRGVTVSMSAFLACHQCHCAGSSLAWGLNLRAVVCGIF